MKKSIIIFFLFLFLLINITTSKVSAALVDVNPQGKLVWQVLGDSTIQVKKIALNIAPSTNTQVILNNSDGKVMLNGVDVTNLKETLVDVEARGSANELKIGQNNGQFTLVENGIVANTGFPITIDPVDATLTVTTPTGARLLSILPYEAILSLMRAKLIDQVNGKQINLSETQSGELQYGVNGTRHINLFNLTKIDVDIHSSVSATTGEILKLDEPQWLKVFGFLFS